MTPLAPRVIRPADALTVLLGIAVFQGTWLVCVAAAAQGHPLLGSLTVVGLVLAILARSDDRQTDIQLVLEAVILGAAFDGLLLGAGLVEYASPTPAAGWSPIWIVALWAQFGAILRGPLHWLHGRLWLGALLGAVGGPLSYLGAERLGACQLGDGPGALIALAVGWGIAMPALLLLARMHQRGQDSKTVARS
ncbi:MAG: DUF2878 domain-containing protein [Burkholderiaceae bacterium]